MPDTSRGSVLSCLAAAALTAALLPSAAGAAPQVGPSGAVGLVINEIQADPDGSIAGDANGDGIRHFQHDEFVEIVNDADVDVDLSGWTLADRASVRHRFPIGTVVAAECSIVVFGGGTPTGEFGDGVVQTASSGMLALNNGGDTVTLSDGGSTVVSVGYGAQGGRGQSLTRSPDITGPLTLHSGAPTSRGALFSPGTRVDGSSFDGCVLPGDLSTDCGAALVTDEGVAASTTVTAVDTTAAVAAIRLTNDIVTPIGSLTEGPFRPSGGPGDPATLDLDLAGAADVGLFTAEIEAESTSGEIEACTLDIEVRPRPLTEPIADAGGPYSVDEGDTLVLDASGSNDPDGPADTLTHEWDLDGDWAFDDATGVHPVLSATGLDGPSIVTVAVRVTDADGLSDTATATVSVNNVAPVIVELATSATCDTRSRSDEPTLITGTFADPGTLDTHSVTLDWGDLTASSASVIQRAGSGSFEATHRYATGGIYTITVTVIDDDTGHASETTTTAVTGVGVDRGELQIIGTDGNDRVHVKRVRNRIDVFASFLRPRHLRFDAARITSVVIQLCDGHDRAKVHASIELAAAIHGDDGNDRLMGGSGNDRIFGGEGADRLWGRAGDDLLDGGPGRDRLDGGRGDDELVGGDGRDKLRGRAGDDLLDGGPGNDRMFGGRGRDTLID